MTLNTDTNTSTSNPASTPARQYIPTIGKRVTLREFAQYGVVATQHPEHDLSVWSHLTVRYIAGDSVNVEHYNAGDTGITYFVPMAWIAPPIGWKSRYTIHCKPDEVSKVLGWFARGVVVRASNDLGNAGTMAFQPMTDGNLPGMPHWQYVENTDVIPASECVKVFRVVSVETEEVSLGHDPECERCKGTGRDTIARLAGDRSQTIAETMADIASGKIQFTDYHEYNAEQGTYACHCNLTLRDLGRTKRAKAIKAMVAEGWSVEYRAYAGGFWERQRETVVKDWE